MRTIESTAKFRRDLRRAIASGGRKNIEADLRRVISLLAEDQPLEHRHADHALIGEWHRHRDCHVYPDLVLIYMKAEPDRLVLVRLGSHSELGL